MSNNINKPKSSKYLSKITALRKDGKSWPDVVNTINKSEGTEFCVSTLQSAYYRNVEDRLHYSKPVKSGHPARLYSKPVKSGRPAKKGSKTPSSVRTNVPARSLYKALTNLLDVTEQIDKLQAKADAYYKEVHGLLAT